ncbi:MAG: hypothetical protein EA426_15870 [Spirochaetaceae bacterium]|nr:MAG: hypothetical protein EA426_15870 [Spirochaetaceae bacterium]
MRGLHAPARSVFALCLILFFGARSMPADEFSFDFDDMFDDDMIEEVDDTDEQEYADAFLDETGITFGGRFSSSLRAIVRWAEYPDSFDAVKNAGEDSLAASIDGRLFFDARPNREFRVYGSARTAYPFTQTTRVLAADEVTTKTIRVPNISIFELFSDFAWRDYAFFRAGKQTVSWGTGYFFSPADVLSLSPIDPEDPERTREGPISIRVRVPIDIHQFTFYLVAPDSLIDNPNPSIKDLAIGPRFEFVVGPGEIGIAGFLQQDLAPRAIMTAGFSWRDLDTFGEAVLRYGSERTFLADSGSETFRRDDGAYFDGTIGVRYVKNDVSLIGQVLYNGDGYDDPKILESLWPAFGLQQEGAPFAPSGPTLTLDDLTQTGRWYGALSAGHTDVFGTDIGVSALLQANFSDGSGIVGVTVSRELFTGLSLSATTNVAYGEDRREFTQAGRFGVSLGAQFGTTRF